MRNLHYIKYSFTKYRIVPKISDVRLRLLLTRTSILHVHVSALNCLTRTRFT